MEIIRNRLVVKVGTSTLTHENGEVDIKTMDKLVQVLSALRNSGYEIILVSSGAIAVGFYKMRLPQRSNELRMKQAAAAVGQCELIHMYDKLFSEYGNMVAQVLLVGDEMNIDEKRHNLKNTFFSLLENKIIPIVNANDSVSYNQIESENKIFGDNDTLSAVVAILCSAEKLIILSDREGMYDDNPNTNPNARLIHNVERIDDRIRSFAQGAGSKRGTGGMITKLEAAETVTACGIEMFVTYGREPTRIYDLLEGRTVGTRFAAQKI